MSYDRKTKFSKNHKNPSFPKLVPRVLPFRLEGREPQNRKIEKIQFFIFSGGGGGANKLGLGALAPGSWNTGGLAK